MAQAQTLRFAEFLFKVEDPDDPGTFIAPCGLTSRGLDLSKATQDTNVPDCDDEDAPSWLERDVVSLSGSIAGAGVLDREAHAFWRNWFLSTDSLSCRVETAGSQANGGGYYQGNFHLTKFSLKGEKGPRVTVNVALDSDGEITWTDASA